MKKLKISLVYLLFGFVCLISFVVLLFSNHMVNIKEKNTFKNFTKDNYTLEFTSSNNIKNNIFIYGNYVISGYEINSIYLNYSGYSINLNKALNEEYITVEDILNNLNLYENNSDIKKYHGTNYDVNVISIDDNYKEIMFISNK
jgi:hypothetical protein